MKWVRKEHDEGGGHYWLCDCGRGDELLIDNLGDGWLLCLWTYGLDARISEHATEDLAKTAAIAYCAREVVRWQNVLAQGFVQQDDGA